MIFYSIVYSLSETSNQYVYMFLLLLKSLIKTRSIGSEDDYYVFADKESIDVLKTINSLFPIKVIQIKKPQSHLEGMLYKYKLHEYVDLKDKNCWYIDVDMLFVNQLLLFPAPDKICVFPEGLATDTNYCGSYTLKNQYGYSAGFFCYSFGERIKSFFNRIQQLARECPEKFYTIEQVFFNKALEDTPHTIMDDKIISFNGHTNKNTARVLNLCGDPGDSNLHWLKMFSFALRIF